MPNAIIQYQNLRAELARRNYTVWDVANALGINRGTASAKLSGKREFSLKEAFALSMALCGGLSIDYLFAEKYEGFLKLGVLGGEKDAEREGTVPRQP